MQKFLTMRSLSRQLTCKCKKRETALGIWDCEDENIQKIIIHSILLLILQTKRTRRVF